MMFPIVHMNGTSIADLVEQYRACLDAVSSAIRVMYENGPNARDYYPKGADAFPTAVAEHKARVAKLIEVQAELNQICESLFD